MTIRLPAWLPGWLRRVALVDAPDAAAWRNRQLLRSIATSFFSKGVSLVLQGVAIPLAIRALGPEQYGVYAVLTGALAWTTFAGVGVGPGLTLQLASQAGDRRQERRLVTTAGALMLLCSLGALTAIAMLVWLVGIRTIFGPEVAAYSSELQQGLILMSFLLALNLVLSIIDAVQAGYQNQYITNLWTIAGNLLTIILLLSVAFWWPTVSTMIVAIYGSITIARIANGISLFLQRPYLFPSFAAIDRHVIRLVVGSGLAFLLGQLASYTVQGYGAFWTGRIVGPQAAAIFAVMAQLMLLGGSFVTMFTAPLWPALAHARAQNDVPWIRTIRRRATIGLVGYGAVLGFSIAAFGDPMISHWISPLVAPPFAFQVLSGLFAILVVWDHLNYTFLLGLGRVWPAALALSAGAAVVLVTSFILVPIWGVTGMAAAQCAGSLAINSWLLRLLVHRELCSLEQKVASRAVLVEGER